MIDSDISEIKNKAVTGVSALVLRNLLLQPISFFGFFLLSIFLQRWELGLFWAVSEIIAFLGYFSDIGLAAAVIQKKEEVSKEEIKAVFTIQQLLVGVLIITALVLTPYLQLKFNFDDRGKVLFYSLLFGFFAASLKTIPSVLLERKLKFEILATVDLVEQIIFTGMAVFFAWQGFGIRSWIWAIVVRSVVGVILIYYFSPWPVGLNFQFKKIKHLIKFGAPFQINSFLAVLKDRLVNIFLWGVVGSDGIGILGWAQKWAQMPLRFFLDSAVRVSFPAYSRLQEDKKRLSAAVERSCFLVNFSIFPMLAGMAAVMPKIVEIFPKYNKWSVALIPFWLYLVNFAFGAATTPMVNCLNAVGKIKKSLKLMVMWTVLTWFLVLPFSKKFGTNGAALALMIVSSSSIIAWLIAKKEFKISLFKIIGRPFILTMAMFFVLLILTKVLPKTLFGLLSLVVSGVLVYLSLSFLFVKKEIFWFWRAFKGSFLKK